MEAHEPNLLLSDQQQSLRSRDHLQGEIRTRLDDLGDQFQHTTPENNIQVRFYLQFKKIYQTSFKLWSQLRKQSKIKESLAQRVTTVQTQLANLHRVRRVEEQPEGEDEVENEQKRRINKRMRRTAEQIERKYTCSAEMCDRCYGSQGSLQQHIKLKHPELYKKEGESYEIDHF